MDIAVPIEEKNGSAWNHCRGVHGRPIAGVMGQFRPEVDCYPIGNSVPYSVQMNDGSIRISQ